MATQSNVVLPQDIILSEILTRLPVKFVIRCKSVCKPWLSQISDTKFTQNHNLRNRRKPQNPNSLIAYGIDENPVRDLHFVRINDSTQTPPNLHRQLHWKSFWYFLGSVHGLVCFHDYDHDDFVVWNPATNQEKVIPKPLIPNLGSEYKYTNSSSGFASDPVASDFKIIHILRYIKLRSPKVTVLYRAQVYSCKLNTWKDFQIDPAFSEFNKFRMVCNVKGTPYWRFFNKGERNSRGSLVAFDVNEDMFKWYPCPDSESFINWKESLAFVNYSRDNEDNVRSADVYTLNESSGTWAKTRTFYVGDHDVSLSFENDDIVVSKYNELFLLDTGKRQYKDLGIDISQDNLEVVPYIESLVSIDGMTAVRERIGYIEEQNVEPYL